MAAAAAAAAGSAAAVAAAEPSARSSSSSSPAAAAVSGDRAAADGGGGGAGARGAGGGGKRRRGGSERERGRGPAGEAAGEGERAASGAAERAAGEERGQRGEGEAERRRRLRRAEVAARRETRLRSLLLQDVVDLCLLREEAAAPGGLVCCAVRRRAWPKLLGVNICAVQREEFREDICAAHTDLRQIECDVDRSLWSFSHTRKWRAKRRNRKREVLADVVAAVVCRHPQLHYYQGFHDIASVCLLVSDSPEMAFCLTESIALHFVRDSMGDDFESISNVLPMIFHILQIFDPVVFEFLHRAQLEPFFATPWVITWFSHDVRNFDDVCRIFDLLLATHPATSLYLSAAVILARKDELLLQENDLGVLHQFLAQIPQDLPWEDVIDHTLRMMDEFPPEDLFAVASTPELIALDQKRPVFMKRLPTVLIVDAVPADWVLLELQRQQQLRLEDGTADEGAASNDNDSDGDDDSGHMSGEEDGGRETSDTTARRAGHSSDDGSDSAALEPRHHYEAAEERIRELKTQTRYKGIFEIYNTITTIIDEGFSPRRRSRSRSSQGNADESAGRGGGDSRGAAAATSGQSRNGRPSSASGNSNSISSNSSKKQRASRRSRRTRSMRLRRSRAASAGSNIPSPQELLELSRAVSASDPVDEILGAALPSPSRRAAAGGGSSGGGFGGERFADGVPSCGLYKLTRLTTNRTWSELLAQETAATHGGDPDALLYGSGEQGSDAQAGGVDENSEEAEDLRRAQARRVLLKRMQQRKLESLRGGRRKSSWAGFATWTGVLAVAAATVTLGVALYASPQDTLEETVQMVWAQVFGGAAGGTTTPGIAGT